VSLSDQRVQVPGSAPKHGAEARWSPTDPNEPVAVTIVLRRRADSPDTSNLEEQLLSGQFRRLPREEAGQAIAADPNDLASVRSFLQQYGFIIVEENPTTRTIRARGTAGQAKNAFGIQLRRVEGADGQQYLSYEGSISVPKPLASIITAVLGLDERPVARHHKANSTTAQ
jgi:kumamolisin